MKNIVATAAVGTALLLATAAPNPEATAPDLAVHEASAAVTTADFAAMDEVVDRYCVRCHSERRLTGNLSLETFSVSDAVAQAEVAESG